MGSEKVMKKGGTRGFACISNCGGLRAQAGEPALPEGHAQDTFGVCARSGAAIMTRRSA